MFVSRVVQAENFGELLTLEVHALLPSDICILADLNSPKSDWFFLLLVRIIFTFTSF